VSRITTPPSDAVLPPRHPEAPLPGDPIPSHYRWCYGCGVDHSTGLHLQVTAGPGLTLSAVFTVAPHHQGAPGLAHGGLLAAALDETLGALNWMHRTPAVTARLEVDYRRPVPVDAVLRIDAEIAGVAGRKIYTRAVGRFAEPDGAIAVRARAVFAAVDLEHFVAHGRAADVEAARDEAAVQHSVRMYEVNP
jgi:acyl-coenzyme A thioesterase PaaI-like protein